MFIYLLYDSVEVSQGQRICQDAINKLKRHSGKDIGVWVRIAQILACLDMIDEYNIVQ